MNQLPAYLQGRQPSTSSMAATLVGNLGSGSPPYISIRNNKFTAVDSTGAEKPVGGYNQQIDPYGTIGLYLDAVIIDANEHTSKVWFEKSFETNEESWVPPTCWSDNGIGPSRQCAAPQARTCQPDATNTHGCAKAVWGSAVGFKGTGVKACRDIEKFAIMIPGDDILYQFRLPPGSRGNMRDYALKFTQPVKDAQGNIIIPAGGLDMKDVVTRIWFDQQQIGTVKFVGTAYLDDQTVAQRNKALAEKKTDALVGRGDMPVQQLLAAPQTSPYPATDRITVQPNAQSGTGAQVSIAPLPSAQPAAQQSAGVFTEQPAATAQTAAPSPQPETQRRRRRTRAEIDAANGTQAPAAQQTVIPPQQAAAPAPAGPFAATQAAQPAPNPQPAAQPNNFGMQAGVAPNPEIEAALADIFGK